MSKNTVEIESCNVLFDFVLDAGESWIHDVRAGQTLRIVDLEGNQSADTLIYNANDQQDRYSATDTIIAQRNIYLTTGSRLLSIEGNLLMTIVDDTCGRHDTIGGACSAESNTVRYSLDKKFMHSCRDSFLHAVVNCNCHLGKRDLTSNINFFMNVPVSENGDLNFADGLSGPGKYVDLRADMDVKVLISNCPQLNNPCNAYNPTPLRLMIW
ncbi:urea amidolyase associated protein UAAP2 [Acidithiobacillus ferriphilus]|uniref:urea amidolyase associated protein UAAP2 n=1 Tax=Acidithiobacillus ferriphilus TaxID=1689834 RepID=UPI00232B8152|nr:urea amidolyase associated protein UAAP2 [Acidithiobacillus ferriphilus]WCE93176.1 DUF1989 domain-containing protein [Acidithiobacillus ferriphilus]